MKTASACIVAFLATTNAFSASSPPNLASLFTNALDSFKKSTESKSAPPPAIDAFLQAYSDTKKAPDVSEFLAPDCTWQDYRFSNVCQGSEAVYRRLLLSSPSIAQEQWLQDGSQYVLRFRDESSGLRGVGWFEMDQQDRVSSIVWTVESADKKGADNLRLLSLVSKVFSSSDDKRAPPLTPLGNSPPERYFDAWSRRDMAAAVELFADDVTYDDTAFPDAFAGKQALSEHLYLCADAFPDTFAFQVDKMVMNNRQAAVQWHVANNDEELPFTKGISVYTLDTRGKIQDGIDFVEQPPPKSGGIDLLVQGTRELLAAEPVRWIPAILWVLYMSIVFFSDGILPGANALVLETRTWEEVRDLSLNFFLVAPLLNLPFSPTVHPMLEGVFNLLLSWAALFAGFLSDERPRKPNLLPMLPVVVGMQFLTSAFLLPYLVTRASESEEAVSRDDLFIAAQVAESKLLAPALGSVGIGSIAWAVLGRMDQFGAFPERYASFVDLLSIDRVGSSFIVDLIIFGLFQGWLVDDDARRRNCTNKSLILFAKFIPFLGLVFYLTARPALEETK